MVMAVVLKWVKVFVCLEGEREECWYSVIVTQSVSLSGWINRLWHYNRPSKQATFSSESLVHFKIHIHNLWASASVQKENFIVRNHLYSRYWDVLHFVHCNFEDTNGRRNSKKHNITFFQVAGLRTFSSPTQILPKAMTMFWFLVQSKSIAAYSHNCTISSLICCNIHTCKCSLND